MAVKYWLWCIYLVTFFKIIVIIVYKKITYLQENQFKYYCMTFTVSSENIINCSNLSHTNQSAIKPPATVVIKVGHCTQRLLSFSAI